MANSITFSVKELEDPIALEIFNQLEEIYDLLFRTLRDTYVIEYPTATDDQINDYLSKVIELRQTKNGK